MLEISSTTWLRGWITPSPKDQGQISQLLRDTRDEVGDPNANMKDLHNITRAIHKTFKREKSTLNTISCALDSTTMVHLTEAIEAISYESLTEDLADRNHIDLVKHNEEFNKEWMKTHQDDKTNLEKRQNNSPF